MRKEEKGRGNLRGKRSPYILGKGVRWVLRVKVEEEGGKLMHK